CGDDNPQGLHMRFRWEGETYVCDFVPQRVHQGWAGVTHGGILATLLDETMNHMVCYRLGPVVTAELCVRYRRPAPVGVPLRLRARTIGQRRRVHETEAEALLPDGTVVATATAKMMQVEGSLAGGPPHEPRDA
ncbi:MAG TPA: PaaI family thioesterase, partial [Armatimonadota bacterium]|nr:PaaI family thioesterase [Armatimonadota bacterium]